METLKFFGIFTLIQIFRYALLAGGAYLYFWKLKRFQSEARKLQKSEFTRAQIKRELLNSLMTSTMFALVLSFPLKIFKVHTLIYTDVSRYGWPWWIASLILLVAIHDTYFYFMHRLVHHPKLFRTIHREHHLSTNPNPLTAYSFSPAEAFIEVVWIVPLFFLIPLHNMMLLTFAIFSLAINVVGHLGIEIYPAWFENHPVFKYLNLSTYHNLHHHYARGYYGLYFTYWDRLFKTDTVKIDVSNPSGLDFLKAADRPTEPTHRQESELKVN